MYVQLSNVEVINHKTCKFDGYETARLYLYLLIILKGSVRFSPSSS